jgi:NAD(P)H-hydrate epimerase
MSRLTGLTVQEILDNPLEAAVRFAGEFNVVTLLKDAHTIIAHPKGNFYINTTGCNALSKAGTGDVLAGMIAGFIAQG